MDSASLSAASGLRAWRWILPNDHQHQRVSPPIGRHGNDGAVSLSAAVAYLIRRWCERAGVTAVDRGPRIRTAHRLIAGPLIHHVHILAMDGDSYRGFATAPLEANAALIRAVSHSPGDAVLLRP